MIPVLANPWAEEPASRAGAAVASVLAARRRIEEVAPRAAGSDAALRSEILAAAQALGRLSQAIQADHQVYRTHRALFVVQVPNLLAVLDGIAEARSQWIDDTRMAPVTLDLRRLLAAPAEALATLDASALERLALMAETAAAALPAPEASPQAAPARSRLGSLLGRAREASGDALSSATSMGLDAGRRAGSAAAALGSYAGSTVTDSLRLVTDPVLDSFAAARSALAMGVVSGLILGAVIAVICPPLAPWAAGAALLDLPGDFSREMDRATRARAQERALRSRLRGEDLDRALAILWSAERRTRIETPVLQIVIDLDGSDHEGTVLAGRFAGKALASLGASDLDDLIRWAPDEATAQALTAWRQAQVQAQVRTGAS